MADGVAFAPHRAIDVQAWDVDWYVYSTYKVYGPHMAVMFGKKEALAETHRAEPFLHPRRRPALQVRTGRGQPRKLCGIAGAGRLPQVSDGRADSCDRAVIEQAFARMQAWEEPLIDRLLDYLNNRKDLRVIGPAKGGPDRVGTISFLHDSKSSRAITEAVDKTSIAIRHGHMYAWHLCDALGLDLEDGVVRVSFVHYNTLAEIDRLIEVFEQVL